MEGAGAALVLAIVVVARLGHSAEAGGGLRGWAIGDVIDADIVAPFALTVFHPEETAALRAVELPKVPTVWRRDPAVGEAVAAELRARFTAARESFGELIDRGFQQRPLQNVAGLSDRRFFAAMAAFRGRDGAFPLSTNLAELWALGDAGLVVQEDFAGQLRRFMSAHLRADRPEEAGAPAAGSAEAPVWIISAPRAGANDAATGVSVLDPASLYSLSRYRRELIERAPVSDRPVVGFLAGLLRPNCVLDAEATGLARARRQQEVNVVDLHEAGTIVARRGERVDARLKRTLDTLRTQLQAQAATGSAARLQAELERARTEAIRLQSLVKPPAGESRVSNSAGSEGSAGSPGSRRWIGASAMAGLGLVVTVAWWWHRQRRWRNGDWAIVTAQLGGVQGAESEQWRERALAAEARAAKATAMLRARMVPHLARWMMNELVQRLLHQRTIAQSSQQRAEQEVAELAARLERLQAPLEERRRAYEQRIHELEAQLAARDRQDSELIQARLESTRRRLQSDHDDPQPFAS